MRFTLILLPMLFIGCASIVSNSDYMVLIDSNPDGAHVTVTDENGCCVYDGLSPITLSLDAEDGYFDGDTYTVHFSLEGYRDQTVTLDSSLDGWYFGNLLFGGLIGFFIIDPITGSMYSMPDRAIAVLKEQDGRVPEKEMPREIELDMTTAEVESILGEPDIKDDFNESAVWTWEIEAGRRFKVLFESNRVLNFSREG